MKAEYDLIVIGAGPAGYVAAIKAAQLGMHVACIEKNHLGGTCLNVGCIPSKALLYTSLKYTQLKNNLPKYGIHCENIQLNLNEMMQYKEKVIERLTGGINYLFNKNKITHIKGAAKFISKDKIVIDNKYELQAKNFVIATGSKVRQLPFIQINEQDIVSSTGALSLTKVPEHLVVIGGGYIGLELSSVWQRLGAKVTVIELSNTIVPGIDRELSVFLQQSLTKQGINFKLAHKVQKLERKGSKKVINIKSITTDAELDFECDVVLSCIGRMPNTDNLDIENINIQTNNDGQIIVDKQFRTIHDNILAIGDVINGPMLAHKGIEEGLAVAEIIAGQKTNINYDIIPSVIYTHPEVAYVGKTQQQLKDDGIPYNIGKAFFSANGRAIASDETEGFVKVMSNQKTDEILGIHIVHAEASTMIGECSLAMAYRASSEDIARTCHAHPTINEALKEAAMATYDKSIHS